MAAAVLFIIGAILVVAFFVGRSVANMFKHEEDGGGEEYIEMPTRREKDTFVGYEDILDDNVVPMRGYVYPSYYC